MSANGGNKPPNGAGPPPKTLPMRRPRTSETQFKLFVQYATKHPAILSQYSERSLNERHWRTLAQHLNSPATFGPNRTTEEWMEILKGWKHNVRHRARQSELHKGNPSYSLNALARRALAMYDRVDAEDQVIRQAKRLGQVEHGGGSSSNDCSSSATVFADREDDDDDDEDGSNDVPVDNIDDDDDDGSGGGDGDDSASFALDETPQDQFEIVDIDTSTTNYDLNDKAAAGSEPLLVEDPRFVHNKVVTEPSRSSLLAGSKLRTLLQRRPRLSRTNKDQYEIFLAYAAKNYGLIHGHGKADELERLWAELAAKLNARMGGAPKGPDDWRRVMQSWRYQLRYRSNQIKKNLPRGHHYHLTELEKRALAMFDVAFALQAEDNDGDDDDEVDLLLMSSGGGGPDGIVRDVEEMADDDPMIQGSTNPVIPKAANVSSRVENVSVQGIRCLPSASLVATVVEDSVIEDPELRIKEEIPDDPLDYPAKEHHRPLKMKTFLRIKPQPLKRDHNHHHSMTETNNLLRERNRLLAEQNGLLRRMYDNNRSYRQVMMEHNKDVLDYQKEMLAHQRELAQLKRRQLDAMGVL